MFSRNVFRAVLVTAVLSLVSISPASDWPQWRGPLQTAHVSPGEAVPAQLPPQPKKLWSIKVGEGFSSPVVAGGKVFYSDNAAVKEVLHAVDATIGKELWRAVIDDSHKDSQGPPGPRCTPMVNGDRVYAQSCRGDLQCLSVKDGKLIWRKNYTKDFGAVFVGEKGEVSGASRHGNNGAPVVVGDRLIALAGGTNGASVVCLDKRNGKVIWKSQSDQSGYPPPMIASIHGRQQAVVFTCDGVIGLELDHGQLLWRFPIHTRYARHVTIPVVVDDIVMVSSHQHGVFGIRVSRQGNRWEAAQAWLNKEAAINFASPVAVGKYLYGLGPTKNFMCLEAATGREVWSQEGYLMTAAAKAHASFLVMGGNILASTDGGELVLMAADPKGFRQISRVQVCGTTWSSPAYADGKLYVRDGVSSAGSLMCFDLMSPP